MCVSTQTAKHLYLRPDTATTSPYSLTGKSGNRWTEKLRDLREQTHSFNEVISSPPSGALQWKKFAVATSRRKKWCVTIFFNQIQSNSKSDSRGGGKKLSLVWHWGSLLAASVPRVIGKHQQSWQSDTFRESVWSALVP